jgi:hypothetical protein
MTRDEILRAAAFDIAEHHTRSMAENRHYCSDYYFNENDWENSALIENARLLPLITALAAVAEAAEAWQKYDSAICQRGADGNYEITPQAAISEGVDLDALYFEAKSKTDKALAELEKELE